MTNRENELVEKLVEKNHLDSVERKELPPSGAKASLIHTCIEKRLTSLGHFPSSWQLEDSFVGCLLRVEANNEWKVYQKVEASMLQVVLKDVQTFKSISNAIDYFILIEYSKGIDGITVDFSC